VERRGGGGRDRVGPPLFPPKIGWGGVFFVWGGRRGKGRGAPEAASRRPTCHGAPDSLGARVKKRKKKKGKKGGVGLKGRAGWPAFRGLCFFSGGERRKKKGGKGGGGR